MSNIPKMKGRFQQKIGTTEDWQKAHEADFMPLEGEIIIYQDYDNNNQPLSPKYKNGDGKTKIGDLPFMNTDNTTIEKILYYGDANIQLSDEDLFVFTELADGTYSIQAKDVFSLNGDIILPYKYNDKLVTEIAGSGFASHNPNSHITSITKLIIPHTIRAIGNSAFARNDIPEIIIPGSCKTIGTTAFFDAYMQRLILEEGVEVINNNAFDGCISVTYCVIPSTITTLHMYSFWNGWQKKEVFFGGSKEQFENNIMLEGNASLNTLMGRWIEQAKMYYNYGNDIGVTKDIAKNADDIAANTLALDEMKTALSRRLVIKEKILTTGQKFYIHPNSFYAAFPPTTNLALYYGDGRADDPYQNYEIGLITGINSEVIDGKFRSGTTIQYAGTLIKNTTAIYAYFQDNTNEVDSAVGAYLQWNGGSGTYCPILYTEPLNSMLK